MKKSILFSGVYILFLLIRNQLVEPSPCSLISFFCGLYVLEPFTWIDYTEFLNKFELLQF